VECGSLLPLWIAAACRRAAASCRTPGRRLAAAVLRPAVCQLVSFRAAKTARNPLPTERFACIGRGFLDRPALLRSFGGSE